MGSFQLAMSRFKPHLLFLDCFNSLETSGEFVVIKSDAVVVRRGMVDGSKSKRGEWKGGTDHRPHLRGWGQCLTRVLFPNFLFNYCLLVVQEMEDCAGEDPWGHFQGVDQHAGETERNPLGELVPVHGHLRKPCFDFSLRTPQKE